MTSVGNGDGPSRFGRRGEAWVAAQLLLMTLVLIGPSQLDGWTPRLPESPFLRAGGLAFIACGLALMIVAARALGANLTALPEPRQGGALVRHGLYRRVRHPIYGGLMLAALGVALVRGGALALAWVAALAALLVFKTRAEERRLARRFADYAEYRRRTRRFFPLP